MEYLNSPIYKEEHMNKIIEDTEEIIRNFREISRLFSERMEKNEPAAYKLGQRLANHNGKIISKASQA